MSIGSWDPQQNQQHFTIDSVVLKQFIALSQQQQLDPAGSAVICGAATAASAINAAE